jgi:hypothetical protein
MYGMKSCEYDGEAFEEPRSHPWTDAVASAASRYYDLKAHPDLIRTALEDFLPWSHYAAVTQLYELLERLNAPASILESNDCAFSGPQPSDAPQFGKILQCEGRVMILYRELEWNLSRHRVEGLTNAIHVRLASLDREFEWGMVGTTIVPVRYVDLPPAHDQNLGYQLMLSFWAWGDSEAEVMDNLDRVMRNLARALENLILEDVSNR